MATANKAGSYKLGATEVSSELNELAAVKLLSERTRQELETNGHAASPFTGALLVGSPDNYRKVDQAEYNRVARENAAKRNEKKDSNLL